MWPAVPPPEMTARSGGARLVIWRSSLARYAEQDATGHQLGDQGGAAGADERERDTGEGQGAGQHAHVDQRLEGDHARRARGQQPTELIGSVPGDAQAAV